MGAAPGTIFRNTFAATEEEEEEEESMVGLFTSYFYNKGFFGKKATMTEGYERRLPKK